MAFTEFYVTKGSAASDVNGGGPSLGTNDGPVVTRANCASSGDGLTVTDSDGGGWSGASVNDWLCFDTAGTKNYTRITVISGNDLTVSPAVALSASGKNVNVGGAWATVDNAANLVTTSFKNSSNDIPRVNIKYSATAYSEAVTHANSGTAAIPLTFEGYETTAGDLSTNRPLIDGNADHCWNLKGADHLIIRNVKLVTATANKHGLYADTLYSDKCRIERVWAKATGSTGISFYLYAFRDGAVINCYSEDSAGAGFRVDFGERNLFHSCHAASAGGAAFDFGANAHTSIFKSCIANDAAGDGWSIASTQGLVLMDSCVAYSCGGDGVDAVAQTATQASAGIIINSIFMSNLYGVSQAAAGTLAVQYCAFRTNSSGETENVAFIGPGNVTLSADPFNNAASGDFTLHTTNGADCKGAGFPGALIDGTNVGYADIGALRHIDPAAGGGGLLTHPGMTGGING